MAIEKNATVHWEGRGKQGKGQISTETGALSTYPYGFASRFEGDKRGTNPEEILGAAHAACFAMAFSFTCDKAGFETKVVDAKAARAPRAARRGIPDRPHRADARRPDPGHRRREVPGARARRAKKNCPLSKALAAVPEITLTATLRQ